MKTTRIAAAAALLVTGTAASAQSASDVRCIIVSNVFAQSAKEANSQKAAEASAYFYLGRIGDRTTSAQLKALFDAQAKAVTEANAAATMEACVKELEAKAQLLQSLAPAAPATKK